MWSKHPKPCTLGALVPVAQSLWTGRQWGCFSAPGHLWPHPPPLTFLSVKGWTRGLSLLKASDSQAHAHCPQWHVSMIFTAFNKMLPLVFGQGPSGLWVPFKCVEVFAVRMGGFLSWQGDLHLLIRKLPRTLNIQPLIFRGQSFYLPTWLGLRQDLRSRSLCLVRRHSVSMA